MNNKEISSRFVTLLGFPASSLDRITVALEKLSEKAMPRSRSKAAFRAMTGCA